MVIGIILHPYDEEHPAGLGRVILEWTRALLAQDSKNQYIIFLKKTPRSRPEFSGSNWRVEILSGGVLWLDALARAPKADVYVFNTPMLPLFWNPPRALVVALDFAYRYLPAKNLKQFTENKYLAWRHGRSLHDARHVVAISEATKRDIMTFHRVAEEKISVLYPGFTNLCLLQEKPMLLPENFFLFVGALKRRKNVKNIIRAFIQFCEKNHDHHLLIIGKGGGEYLREILFLAQKNRVNSRIHFLGFVSDNELAYAYKRATAFLFPSFIEGFGFPVLEAMGCGTPVITSKTFSLPETGGGAALLVNPLNAEEISTAMESLVNDAALRAECARKGREHSAGFSWAKSAAEFLKVIESAHGK